jgi:maltooligosyltrehalose trehalohydrolase
MACVFSLCNKQFHLKNNYAVGFFYEPGGKSFCRVWAPLKTKMDLLIISPHQQRIPMKKDEFGYWYVKVPDAEPGMKYLLKSNDFDPVPDPASLFQPEGVHGPSGLINRDQYQWKDDHWKGIPLNEMIIYELHTGTFSAEGDFKGIAEKLDYLADLGINCIEIMPVAQFPGKRNWGYDGVYPFAVQNSYGSADDLKLLIDSAHQKGIAVILDVVYNHFGPEGSYHEVLAPFTTEKYKTPWAKALNFDDKYCDGVREYFWQNALMWLNDYRFDGLRLDAVHAIWDFGAVHFIDELNKRVRTLEEKTGRKKVLIAEIDLNNPKFINDPAIGGFGLDGHWADEFHHALHSYITGEKDGYYEDFGDLKDLAKAMRDAYVYTGQYSPHRQKKFGVLPSNPYHQFVVFLQNHDQIGNRMRGDRIIATLKETHCKESNNPGANEQVLIDLLKLSAATVLLSPYTPLIFMGEEYGERNPFLFFTDYSDENLIRGTREGRKKEFVSFGWEEEQSDPISEDTYQKSKLNWEHPEALNKELHAFYRFMIRFRKEHAAMKSTARVDLQVMEQTDNKLLIIDRQNKGIRIRVLLNFLDRRQTYSDQELSGRKIFDSSRHSSQYVITEVSGTVQLEAFSCTIIELNTDYD